MPPGDFEILVHIFRGTSSPACGAYELKGFFIDYEVEEKTKKLKKILRRVFMWMIYCNQYIMRKSESSSEGNNSNLC